MKRIFLAILVFFLAMVIVTIFISYRTIKKSLPRTNTKIETQGLRSEVQIFRDDNGIPHIFAQNDQDLYFALGYTTAQDRLWQLEIIRRLVNGRLSEVLGDTTVAVDQFLLTIGFKRIAGELNQQISDSSRLILNAYTQGINHFIATQKGKYPIEFMILDSEPQLWNIEDCLAFNRFFSWQLSFAWYTELLAGKIADTLGVARVKELFGDTWANWPTIVSADFGHYNLDKIQQLNRQLAAFSGINNGAQGSNNWVVSGSRSASGKPMLANDPHLFLTNPSHWYMAHLVSPGMNVTGFTLPGSPGVVIGFNQKISWGLTNVMADDADFFVEKINPADSTQYFVNNRWEPMNEVIETIPIRGKQPKRLKIYVTKHGPIINEIHPLAKKQSVRFALRWTGQEMSDETLAVYRLNRAGNWHQFQNAIRLFKVPSQNIVYADIDGNIGYWCMGLIPMRADRSGLFPNTTGQDWLGFIPFEKLPNSFNPATGFLATANNRITSENYPYYISYLWEPPSRILRIRQLLQQKNKLTVDDFKVIQTDNFSAFADFLLPNILPELKSLGDQNEQFRQMHQILQGWDRQMRKESVAAAIFQVFLQHYIANTFADDLGETDYLEYLRLLSLPIRAIYKIYDQQLFHWFDDVRTPEKVETAADINTKSWQQALAELEQKLGKDQTKWRWDRLHRVTFKHFLGDQPMLDKIFNVGPLPMSGSQTTINSGNYSFAKPYDCVVGASMRMIVDMANPSHAEVINPPGQVGHPLSEHFRDLVDFWLNGLYIPLETNSTIIQNSGFDLIILKPL